MSILLKDLYDIKTLRQVSLEFNIPAETLKTRLASPKRKMVEGIHYLKLGERMPILLSPDGVNLITMNAREKDSLK